MKLKWKDADYGTVERTADGNLQVTTIKLKNKVIFEKTKEKKE